MPGPIFWPPLDPHRFSATFDVDTGGRPIPGTATDVRERLPDGSTHLLEGEWLPSDRPLKVGDFVTRDGSDVHRVLSLNEDGQTGDFECIVAPSGKWISVGETEFNLTRRYQRVAPPSLAPTGWPAREHPGMPPPRDDGPKWRGKGRKWK